MKESVIVLTIALATLFVGCENSLVTGPVSENRAGDQLIAKSLAPEVISFNEVLRDPLGFNTFTEVKGKITYTTTLIPRDPIPPAPQWELEVTSDIEATLSPFGSPKPVWFVRSNSQSNLTMDELDDNLVLMEKRFIIEGRNDRATLNMEFHVVGQTLELESMWLGLADAPVVP